MIKDIFQVVAGYIAWWVILFWPAAVGLLVSILVLGIFSRHTHPSDSVLTLTTLAGVVSGGFVTKRWLNWIIKTGRYRRWYHSKLIDQIHGYDPQAGSMSEEEELRLEKWRRENPLPPSLPVVDETRERLDRIYNEMEAERKPNTGERPN